MAETEKVEATVEKSIFTFPKSILPNEVEAMIQKQLKPSPTRALVFENDKQRTMGMLRKGMSKPGIVSFEVLRRAANAVPVARICVNTLKEKITKTKWVIKTIDPMEEPDQSKIEKITELLKNPNPDETWRSFLDKLMEDLLILDVGVIEKTRYPDGELARMYYVDASTIRPVYDEYGNMDCEVPLPNNETLPVSYLQIFNNSLYGGPESGEVVGAWAKQDMIRFMAHPQGSLDNFGYGLSPMEGVLSVVNNLLSSDNYNGSYFDEGSLPPVILHLAQALEQRQLEAYREYMYQELQGNFHRPAIMAGGGDLKIHSLKDMSNTDMQFMEYTNWLAKLMAAAYGLSPQDIGLTDAVGGKNVAETQKDLSEGKGYGSLLHLIKEVINNEVLYKDFGFTELEFEWVAEDSTDPQVSATIQDMQLKNGTKTLNEIREMNGDLAYEDWADQPMLLMNEGYVKIHTEDTTDSEESKEVAGEDVYSGDNKTEKEKEVKKSQAKTLYIHRPLKNAKEVIEWAKLQGFGAVLTEKDMHVTVAHSSHPVDWDLIKKKNDEDVVIVAGLRGVERFGDAVVLTFESNQLSSRWGELVDKGCSWDFPSYISHVTLTYSNGLDIDLSKIQAYSGVLKFGKEVMSEIDEDWSDNITEKSKVSKSVYTVNGYKTWVDDRGFGQPFICMNILSGTGYVIKPPVSVNLFAGQLECDTTGELALMGLNVKPVSRKTFAELQMLFPDPLIAMEFDKYINMTPEYDSEKWRAKHGGSRKFPYYMYSEYIDGFQLNSKQIQDDMKRDPVAYVQAITDLANLYNAERELVLGDRRPDQYIITPNKRAYGFDYQFKGDYKRWEDSSTAIAKLLVAIPMLYKIFTEQTTIASKETKKGFFKSMKEIISELHKGSMFKPTTSTSLANDFEDHPVLFGAVFPDKSKEAVVKLFSDKSGATVTKKGYIEISYTYDWNTAIEVLKKLVLCDGETSGGIIPSQDERGIRYTIYYKSKQ